jgi:hypothetical protein
VVLPGEPALLPLAGPVQRQFVGAARYPEIAGDCGLALLAEVAQHESAARRHGRPDGMAGQAPLPGRVAPVAPALPDALARDPHRGARAGGMDLMDGA